MSEYSGKCDFRDSLEIFYHDNWDEFHKYARVYDKDSNEIIFNTPSDLIPYYPYISGMSAGSKIDGGHYAWSCWLTSSYLDDSIKSFEENGLNTGFLKEKKDKLEKLYREQSKLPVEEQRII